MITYTIGGFTVHDHRNTNSMIGVTHGDYMLVDSYGRGLEVERYLNGRIVGITHPPFPANWREIVGSDVEYQLNRPLEASDVF